MPAQIAIGVDSFRDLRVSQSELVDKTRFIETLCKDRFSVLLLPRPRRFGKTFNMNMLREFFAIPQPEESGRMPFPPAEQLFEGLYIKSVWEEVKPHFQRYPTIFLTFKSMTFLTIDEWWDALRAKIVDAARQLRPLFGALNPLEEQELESLLSREAPPDLLKRSLLLFTRWLERGTGEKALVLIDEYDAPIQQAWLDQEYPGARVLDGSDDGQNPAGDYTKDRRYPVYREVVNFFRTFFGAALKGNPHLYKGVLTGILRVSKESIFSELNNLDVCTVLQKRYSDCFGFTEQEVSALFERQEQTARLPLARQWYNGYRFGPHIIYNPWSVMCFLKEPDSRPGPFWLNTSSNSLIKELLGEASHAFFDDFNALLRGEKVVTLLEENLALPELRQTEGALYSLLLFAGYLKAEPADILPSGQALHALSIPNLEVSHIFRTTFQLHLEKSLGGRGEQVRLLTEAILLGDEGLFQEELAHLANRMLSIMDGDRRQPEALYQGLMLGLCAYLEPEFKVRSNREAGTGRADLQIFPRQPGRAGAVLELKAARPGEKSLEQLLREGERQLKKKLYARELEASGAKPLQRWVAAFDGKVVKVKKLKPM